MNFDQKFSNIFEKFQLGLAANLEKGRSLYDKGFQSSDLFDFAIFSFALLTSVQ
jgi:hypothetical protein